MNVSELTEKINSLGDDEEKLHELARSLTLADIPAIENLEKPVQKKVVADLKNDVWLSLGKNVEIGEILLERFLDLEEEWKSRKEWTPTIEFDLFFEKPEVVRKKRSSIALILKKFLPERIIVGKNCNFFYIRSDLYPQDLTLKPNEYIRLDREDLLEQYM